MIVVDMETTGNTLATCSVVELAALDLNNPSNVFSGKCKPFEGAEILQGSLDMMGLKREDLFSSDRKSVETLFNDFMKWMEPIEDRTFAGAYVGFDIAMFKIQTQRMGIYFPIGYSAMEINSIVYAWAKKNSVEIAFKENGIYAGISSTLKNNYVGLTLERKAHTALEDVKLSAEIINRILYGKNLLEEYKQYPLPLNFKPLI